MTLIGETLGGRYRVEEHLGRGGMAEVYKAYQSGLDRYVAVKVLHRFLADEENFLARFQREAKAVATLRHSNIVRVYDFAYDEERDLYYMVMEYIDGPSLKERLEELAGRGEQFALGEAVAIISALGEALAYAHRRGMVHRDVKPANVMFTGEGQVVLTDFGIAKMVNVAGLTASGAMVGTPAYVSPEQGLGEAGDERSDIYSLGVMLYQLATSALPFDADTAMGVVLKHISEPLPSPRAVRAEIPERLEQVIRRAMSKRPDERYQTAREFVDDLRRLATCMDTPAVPADRSGSPESSSGATTPYPMPLPGTSLPGAAISRSAGRRRWLTLGLVAIMLVALIGGSAFVFRDHLARILQVTIGPTDPAPTSAPTPDVEETQMAATLAALQATVGAPTATTAPTATPTPDLTATALVACTFDVEVVVDRAVGSLLPGQAFVKRWVVRNGGTCRWLPDFQLRFAGGELMGGPEVRAVEELDVGEEWEVVYNLVAPTAYGTYTGSWQLEDERGNPIGSPIEVVVDVAPSPTRVPPTLTPVPTPAFTPTPTERLWMSIPQLVGSCRGDGGGGYYGGRVAWGVGGGPSPEYHYYYGGIEPDFELPTAGREFTGFPHLQTYFTVSGAGVSSLQPSECSRTTWGVRGWCRTAQGYEVVWESVSIGEESCP